MADQANKDFRQYNIGWISALYQEHAAALAMRDEIHERPHNFTKNPHDHNTYQWGKIKEHHVVFAILSSAGIETAASAASTMATSYPHLRCILMVGIGGGIPDKQDIRLGDIVVSLPDKTGGGVVQYDLGAMHARGRFERKGHLNKPPRFLITAIQTVRTKHELQHAEVPQIMKDVWGKNEKLKENYNFPGDDKDRLFVPTTSYTGSDEDEEIEEERPRDRKSHDPKIHYGVIASGNCVIKDRVRRRQIVEDVGEDCLCFEMEAAGLMDNMPCLVVRGICDYADHHKNDEWQRYAALAAAAFTKELLRNVDPVHVEGSSEVQDILRDGQYTGSATYVGPIKAEAKRDSYSKG